MFEAKNLFKTYLVKEKKHFLSLRSKKIAIEAVKGVDISIEKGKIIGLLGINGAGKTTTIKMLTTMISPTSGTIVVDGVDAIKNDISVKKIINVITGGERNIYWRLTATENLEYFGSLYGIPKTILKGRIQEILKLVGLLEAKDLPVERYSKGMKQRLQIARGLINDPEYIFLDEPTLGLDVVIAKELRSYVKKLASSNKGILLTTHYMLEAEELCDYIYIIDSGKIVDKGTPFEVMSKYSRVTATELYVNYIPNSIAENLNIVDGVEEIIVDKENCVIEIKNKNINLIDILAIVNKYEDVQVFKIMEKEPSLEESIIKAVAKFNKTEVS